MTEREVVARFDDLTRPDGSFALRHLTGTLQATHLDEVRGVIDAAERAAATGHWVAGFVAYEAGPAFDEALVVRSPRPDLPLAWFAVFGERVPVPPIPRPATEPAKSEQAKGHWRLAWTSAHHERAVAVIKDHLAAGESYQVNLTARARAVVGDPMRLYVGMAHAQGGAYNAYLETGTHAVACASPELFFERVGGRVRTRPMKGTRPRGRWPEEDAAQAMALTRSAKDDAEHVMIVDLLRNDLGRVARAGTVAVRDLRTLERYPTLWQLTSTIDAEGCDGSLGAVFGALFPSGSVTGAPKPRTMQIIAELEDEARGVYCGAVGYLAPGPSPRARFAVGIRTALVDLATGQAEYGAGGGITWSSEPAAEWAELRDKCVILDPPESPSGLLETLRLDPDRGPVHLDRHLARLAASAGYFAIPFDPDTARKGVRAAVAGEVGARRVRLLLSAAGELTVGLSALPHPAPGPVRLAWAAERVDSRDVGLFHKTADRRRYERRQATRPDADDVILVNERGEVTETTIATLAVRLDGRWWTPPIGCGLLPGVERGRLVDAGELSQRIITVADLNRATGLAVVNSLRGWRPAVLIDAVDPWRCGAKSP